MFWHRPLELNRETLVPLTVYGLEPDTGASRQVISDHRTTYKVCMLRQAVQWGIQGVYFSVSSRSDFHPTRCLLDMHIRLNIRSTACYQLPLSMVMKDAGELAYSLECKLYKYHKQRYLVLSSYNWLDMYYRGKDPCNVWFKGKIY